MFLGNCSVLYLSEPQLINPVKRGISVCRLCLSSSNSHSFACIHAALVLRCLSLMGDRDRSRSLDFSERVTPERLEQLRVSYRKCRQQKRGGKIQRRRLKGVCCGLLRCLIQICIELCESLTPGDRRIELYSKRQRKAESRLRSVREGNLPRRDQHVLEFGSDSEVESEVREAVVLSETESELEHPTNLEGIWADFPAPASSDPAASSSRGVSSDDSRASRIRGASVSANNPLLKRAKAPAKASPAPKTPPKAPPAPRVHTIDHSFLRQKGIICNPPIEHPLEGFVISIDWHQVLDTIRTKFKTLRLEDSRWYYLLDPVKERLAEIRSFAAALNTPIHIIVLSYTHTPILRDRVLGLYPYESEFIDCAVTTENRSGEFGKAWTLKRICGERARVWHIDDSVEVCREIHQAGERSFRAAGIKVPNHWRDQRELNIFWHQNVLGALDLLIRITKEVIEEPE